LLKKLRRMHIDFYKYQGTGNDFILLDNFSGKYDALTVFQISQLCDRRFGIGADGLIKINKDEESDFEVEYFNADGSKSFCGNGARCSVRFVNEHLFKRDSYTFNAIDGFHEAQLEGKNVSLEMKDVSEIENGENGSYILETGSPHYIKFESDIKEKDIVEFGKSIRYNDYYREIGINVNLVEKVNDTSLKIRTYERGVEDETLSCGTGITAAAIAHSSSKKMTGDVHIFVESMGGDLEVKFYSENGTDFRNIRLIGPAEFVFKGSINV
jgi:diaminopimelate epimerase